MHQSETQAHLEHLDGIDWKSWLMLAWVLGFGLMYARMVVAERGGKGAELLRVVSRRVLGDVEATR